GSSLTAEVIANGLDADQDGYRAQFPETSGESFSSQERSDIRTNMLSQLDASHHSTLKFSASQLTTLDGSGTAKVGVDIRGQSSSTTMNATASWSGTTLTIDGTAPLDGSAHGLPNGSFSDCVDSAMTLKMHLVLVPGQNTASDVDASVPEFVAHEYPEDGAC